MAMSRIDRRQLLSAATGVAALGALPASASQLLPTPTQGAGPFYPLELPLDADADLVQVVGQPQRAAGTILHLGGRVLDVDGRPIAGARLEIWQCDAFGVYHHPRDRGGRADPNFQGFGQTVADREGRYRFRTLVPVPYPGRTPHIHFLVAAPGGRPFTTQMYLDGHPSNARDGLYRRLGAAAPRVTVKLEPAPELEPTVKSGARRARFDLILGPGGTPTDA
jgi:protocatechuate 3,4-dioxygenase beta subunit